MEPISLLITMLVGLIVLGIIWYVAKLVGLPPNISTIILLVALLLFILYLFGGYIL